MVYKQIRSLERGVAVLQIVNQKGAATASDISRETGLPRPTVYRILDTLEDHGLVYRSPSQNKVYRLTEAVGLLGGDLGESEPISAATRSILRDESEFFPWPVFLSVLTDDGIVIRETTRGNTVFWTELGWIGSVAPTWEVAAGRVIAAYSAEPQRSRLLVQAPESGAAIVQKILAKGYEEERDGQNETVGLAVPVGSGETLAGSLAMIWNSETQAGPAMIERFLTRLQYLSDSIMAELARNEAVDRSIASV